MPKEKKLYLNLKESYKFICPHCGEEMRAKPSIFMTCFQLNAGGGSCLRCQEYITLRIDEKNEAMNGFPFDPSKTPIDQLPDACYSEERIISQNA